MVGKPEGIVKVSAYGATSSRPESFRVGEGYGYARPDLATRLRIRRRNVLFVLHPFADKVRAGNDTEIATFPSHEISERVAVYLRQVSQIE